MAQGDPRAELSLVIRWLVDTGPLVAYLNRRDPAHTLVVEHLDPLTGQVASASAVITETMNFMGQVPERPRLLAELITVSNTEIYDFSRPPELRAAASLMETYADTPMDFADATLLLLAEGLRIDDVLTLDRRAFSTYRTRAGRPLRLVLAGSERRGEMGPDRVSEEPVSRLGGGIGFQGPGGE